MDTKVFDIKEINDDSFSEIKEAAETLRKGGLVAFPTETVYGLGADALNPQAVKGIYLAKGRPADNPIIVHIGSKEDLKVLIKEKTKDIEILADSFWPGPLTIIMQKSNRVPDVTTGGLDTVAVRMPDNPVALELIRLAGCPIAAPSANLSGSPSPTKGGHVIQDMKGRVDIIISGEDCKIGIESTVLDVTGPIPTILRPGMITPEQLGSALGKRVEIDPSILIETSDNIPRSPGMKYIHYAPKAEMIIVQGKQDKVKREIQRLKTIREEAGEKVGLVEFGEKSYEEAAKDLFSRLRKLDDEGVDVILAGGLDSSNSLGLALMNRMLKAAGYKVLRV